MRFEFSVIVPVFDDWDRAAKLLECLAAQSFAGTRFEVLLVDNGSRPAARPDLPPNARALFCATPGSYAARNRGVKEAQGRWLAFTDADCLPAAGWLAGLADAFREMPGADKAILAGAIDMAGSPDPGAYEIFDLVKGIPQERYVRRGYGATANLALSAELFDRVGGFDARRFSGGDAEFCRRAGALGHPTLFAPGARVAHPARRTWAEIVTKARRIKGGQLKAGPSKRRLAYGLRTLFPPLRGAWIFLRAQKQPLRYRTVATLVLFRVWLAEIAEMVHLLAGAPSERR